MDRRLAAIMSADVVGYSRLMGDDDMATVRTLKRYRSLMTEVVTEHHGRIVDSPGDNILSEFHSILDAVEAGIKFQDQVGAQNQSLAEERRMVFRIGINLGEVIADGEKIYGDGVNIAARLESLADPGGINVSGTVYDQVKSNTEAEFVFKGKQRVKNITQQIRVYRVLMCEDDKKEACRPSFSQRLIGGHKGHLRRRIIVLTTILALLVGSWLGYYYSQRKIAGKPVPTLPKVVARAQADALKIPDRPSLVVLPFVNMSGDQEQEYFSDGITEDLITDLSKIEGLFVISRNSAFTYKGQAVRVRDVSSELGVRYVLEGSVRKSGERVRITAQLIEGTSGYHVWADRYDRDLKDIFSVQDEVTEKIVTALKVKINRPRTDDSEPGGKYPSVKTQHPINPQAYDLVLRGRELKMTFAHETHDQAKAMFKEALELEPDYAEAHSSLGWTYLSDWTMGWSRNTDSLGLAGAEAEKALSLDPELADAHALKGWVHLWHKEYDQALAAVRKAVALKPGDANTRLNLSELLIWVGQPAEAVIEAEKAIRLDPRNKVHYEQTIAHAYLFLGKEAEAAKILEERAAISPRSIPTLFYLTGAYVLLGQEDKAIATMKRLFKLSPGYSMAEAESRLPYKNPELLTKVLGAMKKAGLK